MIYERVLLKELVKMMIAERSAGGLSIDIDAQISNAKARVDRAQAQLDRWRDENKKQRAFQERLAANNIKPGSAAADKLKKANPELYGYDVNFLRKGNQINAELDDAKQELRRLDWNAYNDDEIESMYAAPPEQTEKGSDRVGVAPPKDKKAYCNPSKLAPNVPLYWDDFRKIWSGIPLEPTKKGNKDQFKTGEGPGEQRLAKMFGAEVQGERVPFDLIDQEGKRWEVKYLETAADQIRVGQANTNVVSRPMRLLFNVLEAVLDFLSDAEKFGFDVVCDNNKRQIVQMKMIRGFFDQNLAMLEKKEISEDRFVQLIAMLRAVKYLHDVWSKEVANEAGTGKLRIGEDDIDVSSAKVIELLRGLSDVDPEAARLLKKFMPREVCLSHILKQKSVFADVQAWFDQWRKEIDVHKVFGDVSGLIIVMKDRFYVAPQDTLDDVLELARISQDRVRYKYLPVSS